MHILKPSYLSHTIDTGGGLDGKVRILSETWIELEFAPPTILFQVTEIGQMQYIFVQFILGQVEK